MNDIISQKSIISIEGLPFKDITDSKTFVEEVSDRLMIEPLKPIKFKDNIYLTKTSLEQFFSHNTQYVSIKKALILAVPTIIEKGTVIYDWGAPHSDTTKTQGKISKQRTRMYASPVDVKGGRVICEVIVTENSKGERTFYTLKYYKMQMLREMLDGHKMVNDSIDAMEVLLNYIVQNTPKTVLGDFMSGGEPWNKTITPINCNASESIIPVKDIYYGKRMVRLMPSSKLNESILYRDSEGNLCTEAYLETIS